MVETNTVILLVILLIVVFIAFKVGARVGSARKHREWEQILMPEHRKDAISRSRAVLGGQFSENLAPFLPDFPYKPNECSFLGKPIDFVVFKG